LKERPPSCDCQRTDPLRDVKGWTRAHSPSWRAEFSCCDQNDRFWHEVSYDQFWALIRASRAGRLTLIPCIFPHLFGAGSRSPPTVGD